MRGHEIDWTTGLMSFRARWYHAKTGRWLSKDPIGISGGLNLYAFCGSNPVYYRDPFGEDLVRGNTADANGLHQKVAAGNYGQSFGYTGDGLGGIFGSQSASSASTPAGPNSSNSGDGIVYPDNDPFTKIIESIKTTPAEDKWLQEQMKKELYKNGDYSFYINNCKHYSKDLFDRMKNLLEGRRENCAE